MTTMNALQTDSAAAYEAKFDRDLLRTLTTTWGPSGFEHRIREVIRAIVEPLADEVTVDPLGSLICRVGTKKENGRRIMIAAHMDEIGLMISHIDKNGFMRFEPIGGLFPQTLYGNRCLFEDGTIGVINVDKPFEFGKTYAIKDFYVDIGDPNPNIGIGSAAGMQRDYAERGTAVTAKSLDDRVGCAVIIDTLRNIAAVKDSLIHEVYFVFSVQEEYGGGRVLGASTAAHRIAPDLALAVDVCAVGDVPTMKDVSVRLGGGVAFSLKDWQHVVPPLVRDWLIGAAKSANMPYQTYIFELGSTDASGIQFAREGVPSGVVSIPTRYVHTTSETADARDIDAVIAFLTHLLQQVAP